MHQDKITGAYVFNGSEHEDVMRYMWSCLRDLSFMGMIETILRIIFKRPPKWVGLKSVEEYQTQATAELNRMAGKQ
jgi:hypothetical protein